MYGEVIIALNVFPSEMVETVTLGGACKMRFKKILEIEKEHQKTSAQMTFQSAPPRFTAMHSTSAVFWACAAAGPRGHVCTGHHRPHSSLEGRGNCSAKCCKGNATTSWCVSAGIYVREQTPASEHSCSRRYTAFHPWALRGLQKDTLGGCKAPRRWRGTSFRILKHFSPSGLHITIRFPLLAHYLFSFVQNHLAGSPPLSSRFKANTQDIPKAMGNALRFAKLFCTILMKTHYGANGKQIPSTDP